MSQVIATLTLQGGRFEVALADLLAEKTDAIVNAANGQLAHGGGVAAAIARAAGPELTREGDRLVRAQGPVPTGSAVATSAGRLPFKAVIHAVGPRQGEGDEERRLADALVSAFRIADDRGYRSLSFPAVSSGIFSVPAQACARAYVAAVRRFFEERPAASLALIRICVFEGPVAEELRRQLVER
jgi:O-acetyl-ADP-ribose deacetylase (regulator of RNase III)